MKTLDYVIAEYMLEVLDQFDGNRTKASIALGISIRTLRNWITVVQALDNGSLSEDFLYRRDKQHIPKPKKCPTCNKPSSELWRGFCQRHWMVVKRSIIQSGGE